MPEHLLRASYRSPEKEQMAKMDDLSVPVASVIPSLGHREWACPENSLTCKARWVDRWK
jgi:hypothetical protein